MTDPYTWPRAIVRGRAWRSTFRDVLAAAQGSPGLGKERRACCHIVRRMDRSSTELIAPPSDGLVSVPPNVNKFINKVLKWRFASPPVRQLQGRSSLLPIDSLKSAGPAGGPCMVNGSDLLNVSRNISAELWKSTLLPVHPRTAVRGALVKIGAMLRSNMPPAADVPCANRSVPASSAPSSSRGHIPGGAPQPHLGGEARNPCR